ncbi:integrin beta-8 [Nematolebias whitei]|uniref:integrin beta-8 n=1 Tax=Nematolebias whitei TaxID=451745 RepID=UPI0018999B6D|nr:integrin beta-8 [Nematolebias whitei]
MTSGLPPLGVLLLCCAVARALCAEASSAAGAGACWSPGVTSCADCLRRGPQCSWCFKEDFLHGAGLSHRCDLPENLRRRGCELEFMEQSEVKVEVGATLSSTQVSPQDISITLRPGSEASFTVAVKQLERYPVDLYYLVDVSASMQENLNHLKTVGVALSLRMTAHTSDLWLGFGSFVDKPVSPYINVHPSKINNPCSDYEIHCRPAHGFHHVLSMTGNMSEFTRVIKRQRISGNMDTPEGGLDAMLQAAVCQNAVGWRPEAKRLLLLMTDQPSHLALDSRLGGIVVPHDGRCHLENNVYTGSTRMDHPSLGQLSDKLLENHIYSVFAVEKLQYQWYEELVRLLPGSHLGKLGLFQGPNLIDLVVDAYKRLLSEVAVSVSVEDEAVSRYWVSVFPLCPHGSTAKGRSCSGVQPGQTVNTNPHRHYTTRKTVECNHSQRLLQKEAEDSNNTCALMAASINCVSERVSSGRLVGTFLSVCALTVLCGLVVVAVSRLLMQKRLRSPGGASGDRGHHFPGKDLSYVPTTNEKTVTYRRDRAPDHPVEMHIQVPKMPLEDSWQF